MRHLIPEATDCRRASKTPHQRIAVLDGLRGIAILLVLWIHLMPDLVLSPRPLEWLRKTATGGWIGVELFFVLSGFLITSILLDSKGDPRFFRNFYARRTLRIFPLYYASLAFVFLLAPVLSIVNSQDATRLHQAAPWFWSYCANIGWVVQVPPRTSWPTALFDLRHFWSLAVEEHFYLVWPLIVFMSSLRSLKWVCVFCFIGSFTLRAYLVARVGSDSAAFHQTPCRLDGLVTGAFLAVIVRDGTWRQALPWAKGILVLLPIPLILFFFSRHGLWDGVWTMRTWGITSLSLLFGAVLMLAVELPPKSKLAKVLSSSILRFFGKYSYGIYVIHGVMGVVLDRFLPLDWWKAHIAWPPVTVLAVILYKASISIALAWLSWHLMEKHFLKWKRHFEVRA